MSVATVRLELENWSGHRFTDFFTLLKVDGTMPAFDVDYSTVTFPPDQPERDRVLFNGEYIGDLGAEGYLTGENNKWLMNSIEVPVSAVEFAQRGPGGGPPTPGLNEIEILIDQGNIANNRSHRSYDNFACGIIGTNAKTLCPICTQNDQHSTGTRP